MATPKSPPDLKLPKSNSTCTVKIINTTCEITCPPGLLIEPAVEGMDWLNLPDYSFHITHDKSGRQLLFDLGNRYDWENSVPFIADTIRGIPGFRVQKDPTEILVEGGVKLEELEGFVLSHWHFDHTGNISTLPKAIDLIVGPGFKAEFEPGYPSKETSPFWEEDFKGRKIIEAPFDTKVGDFEAWDYFGDGSFYVLNTPGHATGHISALVRTTEETAVFLGGDLCHFTGDLRPSEYIPLPGELTPQMKLAKRIPVPCPASMFTKCHPNQDAPHTTPFFTCSAGPHTFYADVPTARKSIASLIAFDANPNILVLIAHDTAPLEQMQFFPDATINDWKAKGLKESMHWHFLGQLPVEGKQEGGNLTDGLYLGGKRIKDLEGKEV